MHSPAPLVVHTPGYGEEMSMHPELARYFNVLHINLHIWIMGITENLYSW